MPFILWILLLVPSVTYAKPLGIESCGIYDFQGVPLLQKKEMTLVLNQGSLSELKIKIPKKDEPKFAPYLNLVTKGQVEIDRIKDHKMVNAKSFSQLDYGVPHPLRPSEYSFISLKSRLPCL